MTILDLQRRIREAGRIRIGQQVPAGNGRTRPAKLDTFRLTSADRQRIDQAAGLYGGTPGQWQAPAGQQWEVITEADTLDVIVPPADMSFSMHYELWSTGGCQRRCDGATEQLSDGPCLCDPDERDCQIHTRLSVMLQDLPGLGVWRIDSSGYYAAVELQGAVQVIAAAAGAGVLLPARLRLEQRQVKRKDDKGKPVTLKYAVPVLDVEITPAQLLGGRAGGMLVAPAAAPELEQGSPEQPGLLTPVPPTVSERPVVPVAEQAAAVDRPRAGRPRKNAAQPIPPTGLAPRTAAEASGSATSSEDDETGTDGEGPLGSVERLERLTVAKLKLRARNHGLPVSGTKPDLIDRIRTHEQGAESAQEPADPLDTTDDTGGPPIAPPEPAGDAGPAPDQKPHTDAQRRKLFAVLREHGITDEQRKCVLVDAYKVASLNDLTSAQVARLIDALEEEGGPARFVRAAAAGWKKRFAGAVTRMGADHPEYPQLYQWLTSVVTDVRELDAWAAADAGQLDALVEEAEKLAKEADDG